jgi:hypothetical protein
VRSVRYHVITALAVDFELELKSSRLLSISSFRKERGAYCRLRDGLQKV